ncbi:hypothetical protein HWV03_11090 [Moritella sp. 36]|uniref:hypothetical protein n=1 Tax=Moritella sp. 36 TaxID=2746233 RepID=UPI001BAC89CB|nr:hypothetical protein [Moritella sp. 36]QUM89309.1 hypothetical protein HWV03_11090 [Moritella sp. 36]
MSANDTNLSDYKFDVMVATTQKSINANLKRYMRTIKAEPKYICFVFSLEEGHPVIKPLDDIIAESGINPFELPEGIEFGDSRVQALLGVKFVGGLQMIPGLPDMEAGDIPDIIEIFVDNSATVSCNLLFSEFKVVEIVTGAYIEDSFNINYQEKNQAWRLLTTVNLETMNLDPALNTIYFNNRPAQKNAILEKINQLEAGTFSLEQLYLDLTNAKYQKIEGIEGVSEMMEIYIEKYAQPHYDKILKDNGEPVISLSAADNRHNSSLKLTGVQRTGLKYVDESTHLPVVHPTPAQKALSTFNYMCVTGDHQLPAPATLDWNWINEEEAVQDNGVIAVSRDTITTFYKGLILPLASSSMIAPSVDVKCGFFAIGDVTFKWKLASNQKPTEILTPKTGEDLLIVKYRGKDSDEMKVHISMFPYTVNYGQLTINSDYECRLSVNGNTVTVTQNITMYVSVQHMDAVGKGKVINKTITEKHELYVDHSGQIKVKHKSTTKNEPDDINFDEAWYTFGNVSDLVHDIEREAEKLVDTHLKQIPTKTFESFVFPGADVFTYKDVKFSNHQDLVSKINYQTTSAVQDFESEGMTSEENSQVSCSCGRTNSNIAALVE